MKLIHQTPALILYFFSMLFEDQIFRQLQEEICLLFDRIQIDGAAALSCANPYVNALSRVIIILASISIFILLWYTGRILGETTNNVFHKALFSFETFHDIYSRFISFGVAKKITMRDMESLLADISRIFSKHYGSGKISMSIFVIAATESGEPCLRQVLAVRRSDGVCHVPPTPISFRYGEGFAGLAWRYSQIRTGQKRYLGIFYNSAYKRFNNQNDRDLRSFYCIPLIDIDTEMPFGILSIDSSRSRDFGMFAGRNRALHDVGGCLAKVVGYYVWTVFSVERPLLEELKQRLRAKTKETNG